MDQRDFRQVLEKIALGLHSVIRSIPALRGLVVGKSSAEDAIRVATFGVQANDFLMLQQFLPRVTPTIHWTQKEFGHPGNWREDAASFCLKAFLDVALKIQNVGWIPRPIDFVLLYDHKMAALKDGVKLWNLPQGQSGGLMLGGNRLERQVVRELTKGEMLRGQVSIANKRGLFEALTGAVSEKEELAIMWSGDPRGDLPMVGYVAKDEVVVTCVPKEHEQVKELFPELPEIPWQESD